MAVKKGEVKNIKQEAPAVEPQVDEQPNPNALLISVELAEGIIQYLTSKPMAEVENLVNGIRKSRAVTVQEEAQPEA
tara:strand:+ start:1688 stop:1918 length:231 start_codon:yes stop_codon:yes gene_type:complete